jgi:hypothetical protein
MSHGARRWALALGALLLASFGPVVAGAEPGEAPAATPTAQDETALGELLVTGHKQDKLPRIAILLERR